MEPAAEIDRLQEQAEAAPSLDAFAALTRRITALNALDHAGSASVGALLAVLEALLPPQAALTALDYDRATGQIDLVAVSGNSGALTALFDALHGHALFARVTLRDKKRVALDGEAQTQVHLQLALDGREARP